MKENILKQVIYERFERFSELENIYVHIES